jgi:hypothetical protein
LTRWACFSWSDRDVVKKGILPVHREEAVELLAAFAARSRRL